MQLRIILLSFYIQIISLLIFWILVKSEGVRFAEKILYTQNGVGAFRGSDLIFLIFSLNLLIRLSETVPDGKVYKINKTDCFDMLWKTLIMQKMG